jgi:hypothetical protein
MPYNNNKRSSATQHSLLGPSLGVNYIKSKSSHREYIDVKKIVVNLLLTNQCYVVLVSSKTKTGRLRIGINVEIYVVNEILWPHTLSS